MIQWKNRVRMVFFFENTNKPLEFGIQKILAANTGTARQCAVTLIGAANHEKLV